MGEGVKSVIMAQEQGGRVSSRPFRISTLWLWTLHGKIDFGRPPPIGVDLHSESMSGASQKKLVGQKDTVTDGQWEDSDLMKVISLEISQFCRNSLGNC